MQRNLQKISSCKCIDDLFYKRETFLFEWSITYEGYTFWATMEERLLKYVGNPNPLGKKLNEIDWHD